MSTGRIALEKEEKRRKTIYTRVWNPEKKKKKLKKQFQFAYKTSNASGRRYKTDYYLIYKLEIPTIQSDIDLVRNKVWPSFAWCRIIHVTQNTKNSFHCAWQPAQTILDKSRLDDKSLVSVWGLEEKIVSTYFTWYLFKILASIYMYINTIYVHSCSYKYTDEQISLILSYLDQ